MTNQHPTPPPELVQEWIRERDGLEHLAAQAARWGAEQRLRACIELLDINGCPDRYINMLRAMLPQPQPNLKEQALSLVPESGGIAMKRTYSPDELRIIRRALKQLPDAPAVTPAADDRGPGSVAPDASPVATDEHIADVFERIAGWRYNYPHTLDALRAVYNLGREHGAANFKPTPSPGQIRSSDPVPTADKATLLQEVIDDHLLRFRDDWNPIHAAVERWLIQQKLVAEGKAGSEEHDLLMTLDHPDWQPDAVEGKSAPTADGDRPLHEQIHDTYKSIYLYTKGTCLNDAYAEIMRVVADWLERHEPYNMDAVLALRAEADRAKAG